MPKLKLETNEHFLELRLKGYRQFNSTLLENVFFFNCFFNYSNCQNEDKFITLKSKQIVVGAT